MDVAAYAPLTQEQFVTCWREFAHGDAALIVGGHAYRSSLQGHM